MLNEIINIRSNMENWGFKVPVCLHPNLAINKYNTKDKDPAIKITLGAELVTGSKIVTIENCGSSFGETYVYGNGNSIRALTLLFPNNEGLTSKFLKKIGRFIQTHQDLVSKLDHLQPLSDLANFLKNLDLLSFVTEVQQFLNVRNTSTKIGTTSIVFEVEGEEKIWTKKFIESFSKALYDADNALETSALDVFGNPEAGYDAPFNPISTSWKRLKVFSKNRDCGCYRRFGLISTDSCHIGNKSRAMISDTLQFIINEDHRNVLWYHYSGKNVKNPYLVLTTLCPEGIKLLEADSNEDEIESMQEWKEKISQVLKGLKQQLSIDSGLTGELVVIQVIMSGIVNVGCHLETSKKILISDMIDRIEEWQAGIENGPQLYSDDSPPPSICKMVKLLSKRVDTKNKRISFIDEHTSVKLTDGYEFFFNNKFVVDRFLKIYSDKYVPMLLALHRVKYKVSQIANYFKIGNLILHKLGYHFNGESSMEHWAFYLGRLFNHADWADRIFFKERGMPIPDVTCGKQFIGQAYRCPQAALGALLTKFNVRVVWASTRAPGILTSFKSAHENLMRLCDGHVPKIASDVDKAMLAAGYLMFEPKKEVVENEPVNS